MPVSPLAPAAFPDLPVIDGVRFASAMAGVKYNNRTDVMLAELVEGSTVAGVFTRSATRSANVLDCQAKNGKTQAGRAAIIVNSGNSNAFTGARGVEAVDALCAGVAEQTGIDADRIFTSSTGVIGEPLPYDRITAKIGELSANLNAGGIEGAAKAIMTTDTFPKGSAAEITVKGQTVKIAGIAKGSGMIAPDMATMLVYIFTDAKIGYEALQGVLSKLTNKTFNCITVDSDTSTSDTLLIGATGASGVDVSDNADFEAALHKVMLDLSHQVIRDGEGATKFVEIQVTGAASDADAKRVGLSVANSPLVKTAIAGEDANWGRIVAAVGKSGAEADRDRLSIRFGDITVAENGWRAPNYSEADASAYMKNAELIIGVDLGIGTGASTVWTCDLTYEYIRINADYRS
ncbi:MAG: bifunctional glutamate N-acetyltransferase/amino-acid acetyltransferase ArgJ [Marivivens sp.]|jgi:glutamate N-acetyltransferase / amino-acid N-acetyltransferase|uniref:bifunctional glutamate N-acetyltransferase/amino-acid acetyltransferase ArgJ n=1 Tax=Marivivens sp. TaxID=1978374 RepID=UPI00201F2417|nr:bifunctional glutamate N-acetyltransferase/amino-acid acetyltransferase ArgJ [Marivivens sp.]MCL7404489.1 bifunctional glutamate N-acetyltransferase/amino-acid acetyltransferase ArgJ [Marivivens geojensis]NBQ49201.1 bifunctional glutamate N-acetyltransferase/amino-acid acetyltransferase ArgJ [Marivivens sp.]NBT50253.1 bifunctional glutamate N-acetyltransferase/amino-acid acetyltransferase ArgJ [Marivivens sp.]NBX08559.1 bifunctional glutamate N-acetyltransferase/amino-acid acetyltransferase 